MSALQHLANCRGVAARPLQVKRIAARKLTPPGPPPATNKKIDPKSADENLALVQRAAAGEPEAQTRLFAIHMPMLSREALRASRNKEDAKDAVQDTRRRAYAKLHTFEGRSSIFTWLTRIAINSALMIHRRNKRRFEISMNEASGDEGALPLPLDDGHTSEKSCSHAELHDLLTQQIDRLSPLIRAAFLLRDVDAFTTEESIELLGMKSSALRSRVLRPRQRLAHNLRRLLSDGQQPKRLCRLLVTQNASVRAEDEIA